MEFFLMKYGLAAVFFLAMAEADVVPVLTGAVAHLGYFGFASSIVVASTGAFTGDCVWYLIARTHSGWVRSSRIYTHAGKVVAGLDRRFSLWQIPASHIIYGTRVATMALAGIKKISFIQFAVMDMLGCLFFTTTFITLGFLFSSSVSLIIGHVKRVELSLLLVLILTALAFHLVKLIAQRQAEVARKTSGEHNSP
jgi:membrane protein DedA with SNARE-associated domain